MRQEIKTKAIVLHEMPIGEYDKRLLLLTKEKGKITVFARGVRKANSKLLAGCSIFAYGDYLLKKGRSAYHLTQVQLIESFHSISKSIELLAYGLYLLEFSEFVSEENNPNNHLLRLLLKTLQVLVKNVIDQELMISIFELKAMSYLGFTPQTLECVHCNSKSNLVYFSYQLGGTICNTCGCKLKNTQSISNSTLYTMQFVLATPIERLYSFQVDKKIKNEFKKIMSSFTKHHLNKSFRSLDFLINN